LFFTTSPGVDVAYTPLHTVPVSVVIGDRWSWRLTE